MNIRHQVYCAYAGPLFIVLLTPIWYSTGFLPPLSPLMTPVEVAAFYEEHRTMIRLGATLLMQLAMLGVLWSAAISAQLRRIEVGSTPILTYVNLALGALGFMFFTIPAMFWTTAAYRPERDIDLIYLFNDQAWLCLVMPVMSASIQAVVIGVAILSDRRAIPIYPRWVAYLNFWVAATYLPGALATFFKRGPFAWDGLFDFWIPLTTFSIWIVIMGVLTAKAAQRQGLEGAAVG
jgi:hypothetical protein